MDKDSRMTATCCPVCGSPSVIPHRVVDGYEYLECIGCDTIFIDPVVLADVDTGVLIRAYDADYWREELKAARERSYGPALARVAELLLYARLPVERFLDIGSGAGYLLDALSVYLPASRDVFWGVELFPPEQHSSHPNYRTGALEALPGVFQAGLCMEVIEHLTPRMLRALISSLAQKSEQNSIYLFNTGLSHYVRNTNPHYLDPKRRGHIVSWGLTGLERLFSEKGFRLIPLPGKDWAFAAEFQSTQSNEPINDRIWSPIPSNKAILHDPTMGNLLYVLGIETARAYR